eukprot:scaffold60710_cov51-Cyclotella_meneghiniana.AAC.1
MTTNTTAVITVLISATSVAASLPIVNPNLLAAAILLAEVSQASASTSPFVYLGEGRCRDTNFQLYPRLQTRGAGSNDDTQPCFDFCMQANPEKVAGVTLNHYSETNIVCECHLTDTDRVDTSQYTSEVPSSIAIVSDNYVGTGKVGDKRGTPGSTWCYRNESFIASTGVSQASGTFPFVYLGISGRCRDTNFQLYPRLQTRGAGSYPDDIQSCVDFCMQSNPEKVAGLSLNHHSETNIVCECHLTDTDGVDTSQYTSAVPSSIAIVSNNYIGTGNVDDTTGKAGTVWCFRNENFIASHTPSFQPSSQPSQSSRPSQSAKPSQSSQPSLSSRPSKSSQSPSIFLPSETVTIYGSLSFSVDICSFSEDELAAFVEANVATIEDLACTTHSNSQDAVSVCTVEIVSICGSQQGKLLQSSRELQAYTWQLEYRVIETFTCAVVGCNSPADIAAVSSISEAISANIGNSMENGSFLTVLSSGLWYADVINKVCVTDCESGRGNTCGGLADVATDRIYANPRSCCEFELGWLFVEFCEAESFKSECYGGTGRYYRGDSVGVNNCVKDCDPASTFQLSLLSDSIILPFHT